MEEKKRTRGRPPGSGKKNTGSTPLPEPMEPSMPSMNANTPLQSDEVINDACPDFLTSFDRKAEIQKSTRTVRSTVFIRPDLLERINKYASTRKGFKTEFINYAIEVALKEIERRRD